MGESQLKSAELSIVEESIDATISSIVSFFIGLAFLIILSFWLSVDVIGQFFFLYSIVLVCVQIPKGIGIAVRKRASEHNSNQSKYFWGGLVLIIPVLLGMLVALFGVYYAVLYLLPFQVSVLALLLVWSMIVTIGLKEYVRYYLAGCGEPGLAERVRVWVGDGGYLALTLVGLWMYPSLETVLAMKSAGPILAIGVLVWLSSTSLVTPSKAVYTELLEFMKWSIPTNMLNDIYHRFDTLVLGFLVGTIAVGYYDSSVRVAAFGWSLAFGVSLASNVKISGLHEMGDSIRAVSEKIIVLSSLWTLPMLLILIYNSEFVLTVILGEEFVGATGYLIGLGVIMLTQGYTLQFESILNGIDTPRITTKYSIVSVVTNVLTAPVLILLFGGIGVVYSTVLSEGIRIGLYQRYIKSTQGYMLLPEGAIRQFQLFGCVFGVVGLVYLWLNMTGGVWFVLSTSLILILFYIPLYVYSADFRDIVNEICDIFL